MNFNNDSINDHTTVLITAQQRKLITPLGPDNNRMILLETLQAIGTFKNNVLLTRHWQMTLNWQPRSLQNTYRETCLSWLTTVNLH